LFQLIGTTYGGDGQSTFALPDLRGRLPVHQGNGYILAETGGAEEVTLTAQQIPVHSHPLTVSAGPGNLNSPAGSVPGESAAVKIYVAEQPTASLSPSALAATGGSQPHNNFQPYLCVSFIISLFGIFPSPT
jgi:microcystin-dependent protein